MKLILVALLLVASPIYAQSITVTNTTPSPGAVVTVTVSNGPGGVSDWVGLFDSGAVPPGNYLQWQFLNGQAIQPSVGLTSASLSFTAPSSGTYVFRWFANGGYTQLAVSAPFTVSGTVQASSVPTLLVNGDSNSDFAYVAASENWTTQVAAGLGLPLENIAAAGKYSHGVILDLPTMQARQASLCMVMIGTNDMVSAVFNGQQAASAAAGYLSRMRTIIDGLRPACGQVVIVTPPFTLHPLEVARFDTWIAGLRELTAELSVKLIDVYSYMRSLAAVQTQAQFEGYYLTPSLDKYHLSPSGHAMLAAFVLQQSR